MISTSRRNQSARFQVSRTLLPKAKAWQSRREKSTHQSEISVAGASVLDILRRWSLGFSWLIEANSSQEPVLWMCCFLIWFDGGQNFLTVLRTSKPMQIIGPPIWVAPWGQLDEPHAAQCHHKVPIIQPIVPKQQHRTSSQKHSPTTDLLNAIFCGKIMCFRALTQRPIPKHHGKIDILEKKRGWYCPCCTMIPS